MDILPDDIFSGRSDFVGGIDNEALDFSQLEDFINDENENANTYFVDTLGNNESSRNQNSGTTVVVVETQSEDSPSPHLHSCTRLTLQSSCVITSTTYTQAHNLPESPPDSGSEPPYSPQQDGGGSHSPNQKSNGANVISQQEVLLHPSHSTLYSHPHVGLKPPHPHPLPPTHVQCEPMLIQHPVLTPLLSSSSGSNNRSESILLSRDTNNSNNIINPNRDTILLSRNDTAILLNSDPALLNSDPALLNSDSRLLNSQSPLLNRTPLLSSNVSILNSNIRSPVLLNQNSNNTLLNSPLNQPQPTPSPSLNAGNGPNTTPQSNPPSDTNISTLYSSLQGGAKKRKLSQDLSTSSNGGPVLYVKQEKQEPGIDLSPDSNSSQAGLLDEEYNLDGSVYMDSSYQCIRFQPFQQTQWHVVCDQNLKELPVPHYRVDADKGFNFSNADDAFVCQKKNHFQITCHAQLQGDAQFVKTPEGLKKISSFYLHFYGVKVESPSQTIKVEQSQSDRSKKPFHPVLVELQGEQVTKVTVGRLHFSETTSNNMRKKGKPNPDQRYFYLVVGLHAHTTDNNYPIVSHASERIIVRASNPGQFESDVELCWQKGHTSESIYHTGRVGINTDRPDESLVVHGNLKVTGHIVQPSDLRAKCQVEECNSIVQLKNIEQIRVVKYKYADEFAEQVGIKEDTGVIAQEVQEVLPDAVSPGGDIILPNGEVIENFLVVNKERLFMENIGAVKQLKVVTDHLGQRIEQVEKMNRKLAKLKRVESFKSNSSISTVSSRIENYTKVKKGKDFKSSEFKFTQSICSNRLIYLAIAVLILIMGFCLVAIATLYFLEYNHKNNLDISFNNRSDGGQLKLVSSTSSSAWNNNQSQNPESKLGYAKDKDRIRTTKVSSNQGYSESYPTSKVETSSSKLDLELTSSPLPRSPPVLGRPPECSNIGISNMYGDSAPCQTFCCVSDNQIASDDIIELGVPSSRLTFSNDDSLKFNSPLIHDTSHQPTSNFIHPSKNSEGSSLSETKKKSGFMKDSSSWVKGEKHNKKLIDGHSQKSHEDDKKSPEDPIVRQKRDPDDYGEIYNSNVENTSDSDGNGISISIRSPLINQTLGSDFCAIENSEYHHCVDRTAYNYTYAIPLSRYFSDEILTIYFQFQRQRFQAAESCPAFTSPLGCTLPSKKPTNWPDVNDGLNIFPVDISTISTAFLKYRIPLFRTDTNVCDLPSNKVGISFLEYNLHLFRECYE